MCSAVNVATNCQGCSNILDWCSSVYSKLWSKTLASMICSTYRPIQGPAVELPSVVFWHTRPALCSRAARLNSPPGLKSVMQLPALGQMGARQVSPLPSKMSKDFVWAALLSPSSVWCPALSTWAMLWIIGWEVVWQGSACLSAVWGGCLF